MSENETHGIVADGPSEADLIQQALVEAFGPAGSQPGGGDAKWWPPVKIRELMWERDQAQYVAAEYAQARIEKLSYERDEARDEAKRLLTARPRELRAAYVLGAKTRRKDAEVRAIERWPDFEPKP